MRIRMARSVAGPWGSYSSGRELVVGTDIEKARALKYLNAGLAVAVTDTGAETAEFPVHTGGGWYRLSNGERVQGKAAAETAQQEL